MDTDDVDTYSLAYPGFADGLKNRVSVLAALGTAILGYRIGDMVTWDAPSGRVRVMVEDVAYQPERAVQYDM
ncbi:MAG TPA: GreA/GreB family elongation factor [Candidatus Anammoximicrobium sp.]|nr:GreA/GreB family elongation factor [Candidatus Anammoximicrobium sp.]